MGALLAGLAAGRLGLALPVEAGVVLGGLVLLTLGYRRRWLLWSCILLAAWIGVWRGQAYVHQQQALAALVGQRVVVVATVIDDPGYDPRGFMQFKLGDGTINGQPMAGSLPVRLYQTNLHRGYQVQAEGKIRAGFGNATIELSYPHLTVLSTRQSGLEEVRQRFFTGMKTALPEPMASFGLGLLVGIRSLIPKPLAEQLALVGLSHLVAVSGYNLTIIVVATQKLLQRWGRGLALAASLWLIATFLIVTGASASIVRASLVAVLALLATFYGRRFQPLLLILLAAAATALYQPGYLSDLGWLLSFLAFFGIMILAPAVEARLGHPQLLVAKLFIESTTAQLMTVPLILYIFGDLSIVAPLTNLIILPLVPLAMLLSFIAGLAGWLLPAFAGWLAWPAGLLLWLMLAIVDWFARLPWAGTMIHIDLATMLGMYGLILILVLVLKRANRRQHRSEVSTALHEGSVYANMSS